MTTISQGVQSGTASGTKVSVTNIHTSGHTMPRGDERVSLNPLTPEDALRALLNTPPPGDED
jgi:hypothetical protein